MKRVCQRVPNDSIDANNPAAGIAIWQCAAKANQEDRLAGDGCEIDRGLERDRQPRQKIEAVKSIDDVQILAVGRASEAIRLG